MEGTVESNTGEGGGSLSWLTSGAMPGVCLLSSATARITWNTLPSSAACLPNQKLCVDSSIRVSVNDRITAYNPGLNTSNMGAYLHTVFSVW